MKRFRRRFEGADLKYDKVSPKFRIRDNPIFGESEYIFIIICPEVLYKIDVFIDFVKFTGNPFTGVTLSITLSTWLTTLLKKRL